MVEYKAWLNNKIILVTFKVREPAEIDFKPGQFINLNVADREYRSYSICSEHRDKQCISIAAAVNYEGLGANYIKSLEKGDTVYFIGPSGRFCLKEPLPARLVFVATGTGVAPFIPMLSYLKDTQYQGDVLLYFGIRSESDVIFKEELDNFMLSVPHFCYQIYVSRPENWFGNIGRVNGFIPVDFDAHYYLCGHPNMIDDMLKKLSQENIPYDNIMFEKFTVKGNPINGS